NLAEDVLDIGLGHGVDIRNLRVRSQTGRAGEGSAHRIGEDSPLLIAGWRGGLHGRIGDHPPDFFREEEERLVAAVVEPAQVDWAAERAAKIVITERRHAGGSVWIAEH